MAGTDLDLEAVDALITSRFEFARTAPPRGLPRKKILTQLQTLSRNLENERQEELVSYFSFLFEKHFEKSEIGPQLHKISHDNLIRLIGNAPIPNVAEFALIYEALDRRLDSFRHIQIAESQTVPPIWITSAQLEKLGLPGGVQSENLFNSDFLKTQNWFFFYVGNEPHTRGGSKDVVLAGDYGRETGFIFPFVMYGDDLVRFGCRVEPDKCHELFRLLKVNDPARVENHEDLELEELVGRAFEVIVEDSGQRFLDEPYVSILRHFRSLVGNYFFTVDDYAKLVRTAVSRFLEDRKHLRIEQLDLETLVSESLGAMNLPASFEFRVPVAIPGQYTEIRPCEDYLKSNSP